MSGLLEETAMRYQHGTHAGYVLDRCRCDLCRAANNAYELERRRRLVPVFVGADRARQHIAELAADGVGLKQIAKVSGIAYSTLCKLVYGVPGRGPSKRVRKATEDAVLSITPRDGAAGSCVPAGPAWEIVDRLVAVGMPKVQIAERLGQAGQGLQLGRKLVTRGHMAALRQLDAELAAGTLTWERRSQYSAAPQIETAPAAAVEPRRRESLFVSSVAEVLEARLERNWRAKAACAGRPVWMWFPARGDYRTEAAAKKICSACCVRAQCLADGADERVGIYGGLTAHERRELKVRSGAA